MVYPENLGRIFDQFRHAGKDLRTVAYFSDAILDTLEILGVDALGDSAVTIRVRFKTQPGEQWRVAREMKRRIKLRFDEVGIEIPFPYTENRILCRAREVPGTEQMPVCVPHFSQHRYTTPIEPPTVMHLVTDQPHALVGYTGAGKL